jgi:hypothetical protein
LWEHAARALEVGGSRVNLYIVPTHGPDMNSMPFLSWKVPTPPPNRMYFLDMSRWPINTRLCVRLGAWRASLKVSSILQPLYIVNLQMFPVPRIGNAPATAAVHLVCI